MAMAPASGRGDSKPGRSEEDLEDVEEQVHRVEAVRQKFADEAAKRHLKPSRSDGSSDSLHPQQDPHSGPIPEFLKLQSLVQGSPSQIIVRECVGDAPEDFVETEYYNDLYSVDKALHHTTGTGFIQVDSSGSTNYNSLPSGPIPILDSQYNDGDAPEEFVETEYYKDLIGVDKTLHHTTGTGFIQLENNGASNFNFSPAAGLVRTKSGCNPATNDWIPTAAALDSVVSDKPHRSEP